MKKIFFFFIVFIVSFSACETDFDVNANWKETTIVYGLLDSSSDTQYVKINKAYLGQGDALMMAQFADSINYNPNNLEVKIHKLGSSDTLMTIILDTIGIMKDSLDVNANSGIFSIENNIIYKAVVPDGFLNKNHRYSITIKNLISGHKVNANTEVISNFSFKNFSSAYKFGFYNPGMIIDSLKFLSKTIQWNKSDNGIIYQLDLIFNYSENGFLKSLVWTQPLEVFSGSSMECTLEGKRFFNFLRQNLIDDNTVVREFLDLSLVMTVGTEYLNTYMQVNEPITGIVQQRPQFTNINNGLGIAIVSTPKGVMSDVDARKQKIGGEIICKVF